MAAPGYGYVKRDVEKTTVDWGAVSSSITGALGEAFTAAQKQRAEVELADQTMAAEIQNLPKGATPDQSKYYATAIQNIGDANQTIKDQYENGDISATQYKVAVNALNTQYQVFKNNAVQYQDAYAKFKEKVLDENSGLVTNLFATTVDAMAGMNKTVAWNPETQMLESSYIVDGKKIVTPVSNDLALMSFENKRFDEKNISNADRSFAKRVFEKVDANGKITYIADFNTPEFESALDNYVNGIINDANGVRALEYLGSRGDYNLTLGDAKEERDLKVLIHKNSGLPISSDPAAVSQKAKELLKKDIIASLDKTYKEQAVKTEAQKVMETPEYENFIANKKAAIKFSTGGSQIEFVEHLKRYPNSGRVYISQKDAPSEFTQENPPTFYYYKQGETFSRENLRPVYVKSYGDAFRETNDAARLGSDEFGEFTKIDKLNSYFFDDDGVLRSDTPQRRATKERQGNAPKYLDSFNINIEGSEIESPASTNQQSDVDEFGISSSNQQFAPISGFPIASIK